MVQARPVPEALKPYVDSRIPYDVDFGAPGVHRGLPSTTLTLVLPVGEPLRVCWLGRPGSVHEAASSVSGLSTAPAAIHHQGSQRGIQLGLTVAGARALLGLPAAALAGTLTDLDELDVLPRPLRELPERLHDASSESEQVAVLDRTLVGLAARHGADRNGADRCRGVVGRALDRLARGARVAEVAAEVGYSRRRLTSLVTAECGIGPKEWQRIGRLQSARALMGRVPLAEVAHRCGYSDQAHLSREWTALAGCSPSTWLREEFPFVQDPEAAGSASSEA